MRHRLGDLMSCRQETQAGMGWRFYFYYFSICNAFIWILLFYY